MARVADEGTTGSDCLSVRVSSLHCGEASFDLKCWAHKNTSLAESEPPMHWSNKFRNAFQGLKYGVAGQSSFLVHVPATIGVLVMAGVLRCAAWQWCVLGICIALVWTLELVNSAIELLARGLCREQNEWVGQALDTASAAVLVASFFAAVIGASIFVQQGWALWGQ